MPEIESAGHEVKVIGPDRERPFTVCIPFYPDIPLDFFGRRRVEQAIANFAPDVIHIATEGPLGWSARNACLALKRSFTSAFHTRFPDYLAKRAPALLKKSTKSLSYAVLRRFHAPSTAVMVSTFSLKDELSRRGFSNLVRWDLGVSTSLFCGKIGDSDPYNDLARPILLCVGRVAAEKNLDAFLNIKTQGSLVVIGDGPDLVALKATFPHAHFLGALSARDLVRYYANADLFVFPSLTETFGLVLLEACASGLRVAAFPSPGPKDIFAPLEASKFVVLNENLQSAVDQALLLAKDRDVPRAFALKYSWGQSAAQFLAYIFPVTAGASK